MKQINSRYKKGDEFYHGKANSMYDCLELQKDGITYANNPKLCIMEHRDDVTALNGERRDIIPGKGITNNIMSAVLFQRFDGYTNNVHTHFDSRLDLRSSVVRRLERMLKFEVVVRNIAAGSFSDRFGVPVGTELANSTVELYLKDDALKDPMIVPTQAYALELLTKAAYKDIKEQAREINEEATKFFKERGFTLVDFKIEFGISDDQEIVLADEFSPDTCRLWKTGTQESFDKDRFRKNMENPEKGYVEMLRLFCDEDDIDWSGVENEFKSSLTKAEQLREDQPEGVEP